MATHNIARPSLHSQDTHLLPALKPRLLVLLSVPPRLLLLLFLSEYWVIMTTIILSFSETVYRVHIEDLFMKQ